MKSTCPGSEQLAAFVSGGLRGREASSVQEHISRCPNCKKTINELQEDAALTERLRAALGIDEKVALRERLQKHMAGDYEVLEAIGQGASGVVFKARDTRLNKFVAIKCPASMDQQRRLVSVFNEARATARINHPNVAEVYSLSDDPELPFMVMEYVDGRPINESAESLATRETLDVFKQALLAVKELHKHGIVHRDLKPGNILVDRNGSVKVLDLGIADQLTLTSVANIYRGSAAGTPAYISPEQSLGESAAPAMDVFSLGIILFELLTGQRPFGGTTTAEVLQAIRQSDPPLPRELNSEIPGPLQAICLTALEKQPKLRYPTAREFLMDLERFEQGEPVIANPRMLTGILEHGVDKHLNDLNRWQQDHLISTRECDYFASRYERLHQREELWVLDSRRISFSQVILHLGAWACVISALLMLCFSWEQLTKWQRIILPLGTFTVLVVSGTFLWSLRTRRVALVLLMAASLIWPLFVSTTFITMEWFSGASSDQVMAAEGIGESVGAAKTGQPDEGASKDLLQGFMTNTQLLVAAGTWIILTLIFWWRTKTAAFSLIWTLSAFALATAIFSFLGLREALENADFDVVAGWYLIPAAAMFVLALALDCRWNAAPIAGPIYVLTVVVILLALTCISISGPTTDWLGISRFITDEGDRVAYSVVINGVVYLTAGLFADRSVRSRWLRRIATVLFWLTPTHLLAPVVYFMQMARWKWSLLPTGWTLSELVLPIAALSFAFASVPKQMKSFFFSGLFYVAVAVVWMTHKHFREDFGWPISLATVGFVLALIAWRWPSLFDRTGKRTSSMR